MAPPLWPLIAWSIFRLNIPFYRWMDFDEKWNLTGNSTQNMQFISNNYPISDIRVHWCPCAWFGPIVFFFRLKRASVKSLRQSVCRCPSGVYILLKLGMHEVPMVPYKCCCFSTGRNRSLTVSPQSLNGFWRNLTEGKYSTPCAKIKGSHWNVFRLLHNHGMYFDETLQEASPQRLLRSLCFWCRSVSQDIRRDL